ncbi:MAG TPA: ribonuclease J [Bacilli bacterium]|nr:ribonuclease J [Bacilli bacterium]
MDGFNDDNIKIFALGGLGEVGKNMYVVERGDEIIIIDSGILFPDNSYGVDYIIPDYSYLKANEKKIIGLFITHGHEDHIGGIPYLLRNVKIPKVYASGLAVVLIKNKMSEHNNIAINLVEYTNESIYKFKNFEVSFFKTNHSIPDSSGIAIKTSLGYIIHTGDFKIDLSPMYGHTDYNKLTNFSEQGVLCLLSDSTNANVTKFSISERKIGDSIKTIFANIKGRILISTFASNVHRVQQIVEASVENNRKVIVFGRSMEKTVNVAQKMNYIKAPAGTFISARDFPSVLPEKITILSTGSQGEPLAALSRIADGSHKHIKIIPGDTIIFSSSAIPGNQESINRNINKLYRAGANVIVNSPLSDTHTSGHASETELKIMLALLKPTYFMPIHGEYTMQKRHIELAIDTGVAPEKCFLLANGQVLTFSATKVFSHYAVQSGNIYIDSNNYNVDNNIIRERRVLSDDGMLAVIFTTDEKNKQRNSLSVVSRGFIYMKSSEELINDIKNKASNLYNDYLSTAKNFNQNFLKNQISNELSTFIYEKTERKPMIIPIFMTY